ncbi:MAG: YncE family protein [Asticcacaulis sp.]|uniref:YncE family protein n=1 Tax=Asticcacaulis sp. TaxID=1872648 RepID=UPI003F7B475D
MSKLWISACALALVIAGPATAAPQLKILDTIKIGGKGHWDYATYDAGHKRILLSHNDSIASVDLDSQQVNSHLAAAVGSHIALALPDGRTLLITNGKANNVTLNDAVTGEVRATIATDTGPDGAVLDPVSGDVFVMANHGGVVDVINTAAASVKVRISAGGAPEGAATDGLGHVFTHLEDKNALVVMDAKSDKVQASYAMDDCDEPSGLAYVGDGGLLLSACHNGVARLTDAATGKEVAKLPIGQHPDYAIYDAERKLGYIPCGDGTLTVIDFSGDKPVVAQILTTKPGARTAALDPETGRLYLPTANFAPTQPGARPTVIDDSFEVLVVGP